MKILRFILVAGGIALLGYASFVSINVSNSETLSWTEVRMSQQILGMFGIGILAILAGIFMKHRR